MIIVRWNLGPHCSLGHFPQGEMGGVEKRQEIVNCETINSQEIEHDLQGAGTGSKQSTHCGQDSFLKECLPASLRKWENSHFWVHLRPKPVSQ